MFLQSLFRWFQKPRASSWNRLYAEAPAFMTALLHVAVLTERRIGTLGLAPLYFSHQLITLKGVARATNPVGKGEAIQ